MSEWVYGEDTADGRELVLYSDRAGDVSQPVPDEAVGRRWSHNAPGNSVESGSQLSLLQESFRRGREFITGAWELQNSDGHEKGIIDGF